MIYILCLQICLPRIDKHRLTVLWILQPERSYSHSALQHSHTVCKLFKCIKISLQLHDQSIELDQVHTESIINVIDQYLFQASACIAAAARYKEKGVALKA